ncbi:MAG: tyrosine-type recombinase/integrase [Candidatus Binatia bacterium]
MAITKTAAGTYRVDFRDQTGKRLRKTFETLKEATAYNKQSHGDISKGDFVAPSDITVKDIAEAWYKRKKDAGSYRYGTLHNWRIHIDKHVAPNLGESRIQAVSVEEIENAAAAWAKAASSKEANKILTTLSAIFKLAQRYGPLQGKANAAQLAERLKLSNEDAEVEEVLPDQVYSEGELKKLIQATEPGSFERALVMVPTFTGMRIGEVLGLTWPSVDFKAGVINVRLNLVVSEGDNGVELKAPKSKKSRRILDMPRELAHELKLWKLKCPPSENGLVFTTLAGGFIHRKNAGEIFDQIIDRANENGWEQDQVKRLTFHKLRHTFASLLLSKGKDIAEVSRLLGHSDCAITLKVYSHFVPRKTKTMQELASSILS